MKKFLLFVVLALSSVWVESQNPFPKGRNQLNLGLGLSEHGLPIYIGIDHGVGNDFTIGGEFSYRNYHEKWDGSIYPRHIMGFSGNANYHFNRILEIPDNWDFYAGLNLGFYVWNSPNNYLGDNSSELGLGAQIGGRYYLSNRVALNLELGGGNAFSGGKFGLTIQMKR